MDPQVGSMNRVSMFSKARCGGRREICSSIFTNDKIQQQQQQQQQEEEEEEEENCALLGSVTSSQAKRGTVLESLLD